MGSALAGTALGIGILALLLAAIPFIGALVAIAAVILAVIAVVKCRTSADGRGLAIASIIIAVIALLVSATVLIGDFKVLEPKPFLKQQDQSGERADVLSAAQPSQPVEIAEPAEPARLARNQAPLCSLNGIEHPCTSYSCGASLSAPFVLQGVAVDGTTLTMGISQATGASVTIYNITVFNEYATDPMIGCNATLLGAGTLGPEEERCYSVQCPMTPGKRVKGEVEITYGKDGDWINRTSTGTIHVGTS